MDDDDDDARLEEMERSLRLFEFTVGVMMYSIRLLENNVWNSAPGGRGAYIGLMVTTVVVSCLAHFLRDFRLTPRFRDLLRKLNLILLACVFLFATVEFLLVGQYGCLAAAPLGGVILLGVVL